MANGIHGFEWKQNLTRSVNGHFDRNPILRTGACIKYGVWVTGCREWIRSYGAVLVRIIRDLFFLRLLIVILVREVFPCFVGIPCMIICQYHSEHSSISITLVHCSSVNMFVRTSVLHVNFGSISHCL